MRIALISFEFPPAVAIGGIGAYAWEAAKMLSAGGCEVEVFCAGATGPEPATEFGIKVHRFDVKTREEMRQAMLPAFSARHETCAFDVLESPEIGAEGFDVAAAHPAIGRVVKLHTPSYLIGELTWEEPRAVEKLRFALGAMRRGRWATLSRPAYRPAHDLEAKWASIADDVAAPSSAIAAKVGGDWSLNAERVSVFPLPYRPPSELLDLPIANGARTVGFLGRLEPRKGVVELIRAIPSILHQAPETRFRFMGPSWPYRRTDMRSWIQYTCPQILHAIDFRGSVERQDLARELFACDLMVLPSRWENFPFACWESMAAGRAVVGSTAGGMADVIEPNISGLLVRPNSPEDIATNVLTLLQRPEEVQRLGAAGRQRVARLLDPARILPLQLASYRRAIINAKRRCA